MIFFRLEKLLRETPVTQILTNRSVRPALELRGGLVNDRLTMPVV